MSKTKDAVVQSMVTPEFEKNLSQQMHQYIMTGLVGFDLFNVEVLHRGAVAEYPVSDRVSSSILVAECQTREGGVPNRDTLVVPTYDIGNSMDWPLKYSHTHAGVTTRAVEVFKSHFYEKICKDVTKLLFYSGRDNKKACISVVNNLAKQIKKTEKDSVILATYDVFIKLWKKFHPDRTYYPENFFSVTTDNLTFKVHRVHYECIKTNVHKSKGLRRSIFRHAAIIVPKHNEVCVMSIKEEVKIFQDTTLKRRRRDGFYGWMEFGLGILDNQQVQLFTGIRA